MGNFLSGEGRTPGVWEQLAPRLRERGWPVVTTSAHLNRAARAADMLATVWERRRDYDVALVDVFSRMSFLWAEGVCALLDLLGKLD